MVVVERIDGGCLKKEGGGCDPLTNYENHGFVT